MIRHTFNMMRIEKKNCENVVQTIFDQKDTIKVCKDM